MMKHSKVLVVGTTSDYIDWLQRVGEGRVLFLTDPLIRQKAKESAPALKDEILCDLTDVALIRTTLLDHLYQWHISLSGIACFDCESLGLTAFLAEDLDLPFPSVESVRICRDKYTMSSRWQKRSVRTPRFTLARSSYDAADFKGKIGRPCVLKPVSGSGSELVFYCDTESGCQRMAQILLRGIEDRKDNRLYSTATDCFLIEEFVDGIEYSCDFILRKKEVEILRFTRKVRAKDAPFGTTMGYILTTCEAEGFERERLQNLLGKAAHAVGLTRAICMADFLLSGDEVIFLELTPRPGGDCIPPLLNHASGMDILKVTLDFAENLPLDLPELPQETCHVGLRLHAELSGVIKRISPELLENDPRVKKVHLIRESGHLVTLPPLDYESWYLGHIIFVPAAGKDVEEQCRELRQLLILEIEASRP